MGKIKLCKQKKRNRKWKMRTQKWWLVFVFPLKSLIEHLIKNRIFQVKSFSDASTNNLKIRLQITKVSWKKGGKPWNYRQEYECGLIQFNYVGWRSNICLYTASEFSLSIRVYHNECDRYFNSFSSLLLHSI